jgi:hypothetical protein
MNLSATTDLVNKKNYIEIKVINEKAKIGDRFMISISSKNSIKSLIIPTSAIISKY